MDGLQAHLLKIFLAILGIVFMSRTHAVSRLRGVRLCLACDVVGADTEFTQDWEKSVGQGYEIIVPEPGESKACDVEVSASTFYAIGKRCSVNQTLH